MAREPKRERGKLRVAALLDAAAAVFSENGYDAATMTEIAARANTAIGSMYQFFPSKEALADALLARYAAHLRSGLQAIQDGAPAMSPSDLADALIDHMLELRLDSVSALAVLDARGDDRALRIAIRAETRQRITDCVIATLPGLAPMKARSVAIATLQVLKAVAALAHEDAQTDSTLVGEVREMLQLYLSKAR